VGLNYDTPLAWPFQARDLTVIDDGYCEHEVRDAA
jgi:hypothetical protein